MTWRKFVNLDAVLSLFRKRSSLELPPRILFMTEGQTACSELVTAPLIALANQGKIRLTTVFEHDHRGRQLRRLARKQSDLLIVFRGSTRRGLKTLAAAKRAGKTTVWASDDDLLNLDSSNPVGGRYERSKVRSTMETMMKTADALWTFSPQMRQKYLEKGFQQVHYCHSIAPFSDTALQCTAVHHQNPDLIRIGHIGDFSHANEMHNLVSAIQELSKASLSRKWVFEFVGYTPPELENHPNVRSVPYIKGIDNFHKWLRSASWSIGIAPLRDTPFNRCKTDNKFRTFSGNGIAGIYTNIPPYSDSVVHEHTGLLCGDSPNEYAECLKRLIEDDGLRESIQRKSHQVSSERYHPDAVATQYESILCSLLNLPSLTSATNKCYSTENSNIEHKIGA